MNRAPDGPLDHAPYDSALASILLYEGIVGGAEDWCAGLEIGGENSTEWATCERCGCETPADDLQDGVCVECLDPTSCLQRCGTCFDLLLGDTTCPQCDAESR